jgi:hypothetical protein
MSSETENLRKFFLELIERKIELRAYELFQMRRNTGGSALEDWLRAEDEILGQSISAPFYRRIKSSALLPAERP